MIHVFEIKSILVYGEVKITNKKGHSNEIRKEAIVKRFPVSIESSYCNCACRRNYALHILHIKHCPPTLVSIKGLITLSLF